MSTNKSTTNTGIGFPGLLAILFIGLKLAHVIDWSWWWVLSPLLVGPVVIALFFIGAFLFLGTRAIFEAIGKK